MLNRFSYVGNNPLRFSDPSGHGLCSYSHQNECGGGVVVPGGTNPGVNTEPEPGGGGNSNPGTGSGGTDPVIGSIEEDFGVDITDEDTWDDEKLAILRAQLVLTGQSLMETFPGNWANAFEAFKSVFDDLSFTPNNGAWHCDANGKNCWHGQTDHVRSSGHINITIDIAFDELGRIILHELGHAFRQRLTGAWTKDDEGNDLYKPKSTLDPVDLLVSPEHSDLWEHGDAWPVGPSPLRSNLESFPEDWASMFMFWMTGDLAQTSSQARQDFMDEYTATLRSLYFRTDNYEHH